MALWLPMFFIDLLQFLFRMTAFLSRKWSKPIELRKYVHQRKKVSIAFPFIFNFHTFHVPCYLMLLLDSFHIRGPGLALLVNLTLNTLTRSLLVKHLNNCLFLQPAYPSLALWWIFLYPADLHLLNVFSTTLLTSTRCRTHEMVKRKLVQYMFLHFLTYIQSVRKKDLVCSCTNYSIFPVVSL